jgi:hypothetical protein
MPLHSGSAPFVIECKFTEVGGGSPNSKRGLIDKVGEEPATPLPCHIPSTRNNGAGRGAVASDPLREGAREMADNPIILLHPVREPLDQTAVGALELLARMMLPMDTAERTLFWEGIVADIVSKGLLRGLSPQRAREGVDDWAQLVAKRLIELEAAIPTAGSA